MKTVYSKNGSNYSVIKTDAISDELPVGTYKVCYSMDRGYFLTKKDEMKVPDKLYGVDNHFIDKCLKMHSMKGIGVLLSGLKGTGKTVTAKILCKKSNLPVIIIDESFTGGLADFLESLPRSVIFIDEFEKVYCETEHRNIFLSILDGTSTSKHLFIFTSNDEFIGDFFEARPGRIRYAKKFSSIDADTIEEVIKDRLKDKSFTDEIIRFANSINDVTIDNLTAIIDETNIFGEAPSQYKTHLNVTSSDQFYQVNIVFDLFKDKRSHICSKNRLDIDQIEEMEKIIRETTVYQSIDINNLEYLQLTIFDEIAGRIYIEEDFDNLKLEFIGSGKIRITPKHNSSVFNEMILTPTRKRFNRFAF